MWCVECGIRVVNEPTSYIFCAICLAEVNSELGTPVDWAAFFDLDDIFMRFDDRGLGG